MKLQRRHFLTKTNTRRERERERERIYINGGYEIWTIRKVFIYSGGGLELGTKCGVKFDYGCRPDWK
jgi:hypothetical protein